MESNIDWFKYKRTQFNSHILLHYPKNCEKRVFVKIIGILINYGTFFLFLIHRLFRKNIFPQKFMIPLLIKRYIIISVFKDIFDSLAALATAWIWQPSYLVFLCVVNTYYNTRKSIINVDLLCKTDNFSLRE